MTLRKASFCTITGKGYLGDKRISTGQQSNAPPGKGGGGCSTSKSQHQGNFTLLDWCTLRSWAANATFEMKCIIKLQYNILVEIDIFRNRFRITSAMYYIKPVCILGGLNTSYKHDMHQQQLVLHLQVKESKPLSKYCKQSQTLLLCLFHKHW